MAKKRTVQSGAGVSVPTESVAGEVRAAAFEANRDAIRRQEHVIVDAWIDATEGTERNERLNRSRLKIQQWRAVLSDAERVAS